VTEKEYLVALSSYIPFGPARIKLLASYFGSYKKVWEASGKKLIEVGLKPERLTDFISYRAKFSPNAYFNRLKKLSINYLTISDKAYPQNLKDLAGAPYVLYIRGHLLSSDSNAVSIVGSRKATSYGKEVAEGFSGELARFGVTIISGLARGIDTVSHKAALSAGGRTIAVLGCGLDSVYPPENYKLAQEITQHGALISEYPLGYPALPNNFANRNRIISGLSKAVLVIEGAQKSGTLLTASHASEQGKAVFAVPGQITSPNSFAPLYLIKNGAGLVTSTKDILDELNLQLKVDKEAIEKIIPTDKKEGTILDVLENEPCHLDEIVRMCSLDIAEISARLTVMELKGLVKNMGGGVYKKV